MPAESQVLKLEGARIVRKRQSGTTFELLVSEFFVCSGQMTCVVGESGCGKSTLLDFLALVLRPKELVSFNIKRGDEAIDIASMWSNGKDGKLAWVRRHFIGYVLQTGGLLPFLTVRENLMLPARLKGMKGQASKLESMASKMGIGSFLQAKPSTLSGGQRQRVAILRAMMHDPLIILADEPTAAVDRKRALKIIEDFRSLAARQGTAIVMVTHDQELVKDVADRWYSFKLDYPDDGIILSRCFEIGVE